MCFEHEEHPLESAMAKLVPVSEWVYYRWSIKYWTGEPDAGGTLIKELFLVSTDNHVQYKAEERAGQMFTEWCWITWETDCEPVSAPPVIGQLYGHKIYADGWES